MRQSSRYIGINFLLKRFMLARGHLWPCRALSVFAVVRPRHNAALEGPQCGRMRLTVWADSPTRPTDNPQSVGEIPHNHNVGSF